MDEGKDFVDRLLQTVPELTATYQQHIAENDTLLPHVFMGGVTRFAMAGVETAGNYAAIKRLLDFLEGEMRSGNATAKGLVSVSFVENLIGENSALQELIPLMGETLRNEVRMICGV